MLTENETSTSDNTGSPKGLGWKLEEINAAVVLSMFIWRNEFPVENITLSNGKLEIQQDDMLKYLMNFLRWLKENTVENPDPTGYLWHLSNLIKIIESLGSEHGHSLNAENKKYLDEVKDLIYQTKNQK